MTQMELRILKEAIQDALAEVELCSDISQGVEDNLRTALALVEEYDGTEA